MIGKGKGAYSPEARLEFFEEGFEEITPERKTESKYSAIERVSVVSGKTVYIHIKSVEAVILPLGSFASDEEYESFLEFIKSKCQVVDVYSN